MDETIPVACTLTAEGLAAQAERWRHLMAGATTERAETPDGVRICFRPEPVAEEALRALVATENKCCPWATWSVDRRAGMIVLVARSTGAGIAALHGWMGTH
jgi:hypothetical protein